MPRVFFVEELELELLPRRVIDALDEIEEVVGIVYGPLPLLFVRGQLSAGRLQLLHMLRQRPLVVEVVGGHPCGAEVREQVGPLRLRLRRHPIWGRAG
jgi:hypothetical protein